MSWNNHIDRHGLMAKKTVDGRRWIYLYSSAPRPRPPPDYELTTVSHSMPRPGCCGFSHSPYNKKLKYEDYENEPPATSIPSPEDQYVVRTTVALLRLASKMCEFCQILSDGIDQFRYQWQEKWNEYIREDYLTDRGRDPGSPDDSRLRGDAVGAVEKRPIDEAQIYFRFSCPMQGGLARGQLSIEPKPGSYLTPNNPHPDRVLIVLEYYTLGSQQTTWGAFGPSPQASGDVLSKTSIKKLKSWLGKCASRHPNCGPSVSSQADNPTKPARLLKIERSSNSDPSIQVRLEVVDPKKAYKYVALSHCWSQTMHVDALTSTTAENLTSRLDTLTWKDLPPAFRDTILLAERLDISHVWIDSLCIIQNDEHDWLIESPKMGAIYEAAYVVFAAHGEDLVLEKEIKICSDKTAPRKKIFGQEETGVHVRIQQDHQGFFYPSEETTSWFGRAWCFQERIFGSRILHFGDRSGEICFECNEVFCCECGGVKRERSRRGARRGMMVHDKARLAKALAALAASGSNLEASADVQKPEGPSEKGSNDEEIKKQQTLWQTYLDLCETFTSQGLTKYTDTLPALSSLASKVGSHLGRYLAGLWEYNIVIGLQWESFDGKLSHRYRPGTYVAPTFSWASRTGPVVWYISDSYLKMDPRRCDYADVVEMSCTPAVESSAFGRVKTGFVTVRGYVVRNMRFEDIAGCYTQGKLKLCREKESLPTNTSIGGRPRPRVEDGKVVMRDLRDRIDQRRQDESECYVCMDTIEDILEARNRQVVCLDIMRDRRERGHSSVLVLLEVEGSPGVYRRIGFSTARTGMFKAAQAQVESVTIV